jgi:hypothetical protein
MVGEAPESPDGDPSKYREMSRESVSRSTPTPAARRSLLPFLVVAVVTFFVTWFVLATITGYPVGLGPSPIAKSPSGSPATGVVLAINNPFDTANNSSTDQYAPANFTVPANTLLEFTIVNYDTGLNPVSPLEATVNGTVGNCIYLNSTPTSLGPCVHSVPTGSVAHTFSFENGTYAGFNVPVPSALTTPEGGIGTSVTFFAYFNVTGTFYWHCEAPCDFFSMQTSGFMTGKMTVVSP